MSPTALEDKARVFLLCRMSATSLATVISSPSSIHATPRAITILVWKPDHFNRSSRAGISVRIVPGWSVAVSVLTNVHHLRSGRFNKLIATAPHSAPTFLHYRAQNIVCEYAISRNRLDDP